MKNLFIVWIAFIFALSTAGLTLAQERTKKDEQEEVSKPAIDKLKEAAKPEEANEKAKEKKDISTKPYIWRAGGMVTAVNPKTKTLSVHQETVSHNRTLKLEMSGKVAKGLENLRPGDLVNVWVTGNNVTALNKVS